MLIACKLRHITGPKVCGEGIDKSGHYLVTASWFVKDALQVYP